MEIEQAAGIVVALRRCAFAEAFDEILDASKRHRVPPVALARALVALAEGGSHEDAPTDAARYEWGLLLKSEVVPQ